MKEGLGILMLLLVISMYAETGSISGSVIDEASRMPIIGVRVHALCDSAGFVFDEGEDITDSTGYYKIEGLDPGSYTVDAEKTWYFTATYPELIQVHEGEDTLEIDFELIPGDSAFGSISGEVRLLDFWGEYWIGKVTVFSLSGQILGEIDVAPDIDSIVRIQKYKIENLPLVPCYAIAQVAGWLPQYYDHDYTVEDATQIHPSAEDIDFDLERVSDSIQGGVSGLIRGQFGPLLYSSVYAKKGTQLQNGCINGDDGTYWLLLEPGIYSVYATRIGYKTNYYVGSVTVANQEVGNVDITLEPKNYVGEEPEMITPDYSIQVTPNPFSLTTTISYSLPNPGAISVKIYDASGSLVGTLVSGFQTAGEHRLSWDGKDCHGNLLSSGVYFCRIAHNNVATTTSLILMGR